MTKRRRALFYLSYFVVAGAFVGVCVEAFVRVWIIPTDFLFFKVTAKEFPYYRLGDYRSKTTNTQDGRRKASPRTGRPLKIAFVGDSNTFGQGVDDEHTYVEWLQSRQSKWDTFNFGVPGYGLPEIQFVVDEITARERFDIVAYNFNFNDVLVAMPKFLSFLSRPESRMRMIDDFEGSYGDVKGFAKDHLKSLFIVPMVLGGIGRPRDSYDGNRNLAVGNGDECFVNMMASAHDKRGLKKPFSLYEKIYSDETLLAEVKASLKKMSDTVTSRGGKFVVFFHYDLPLMALPYESPQKNMRRLLTELQIPVLDTSELYRAHFKACEFYADFGHLGFEGTRLVAQLLEDYLSKISGTRN